MNLDEIRDICLGLAGVTEGIKWEDHICFMVAEKIFCITSAAGGASIKVLPDEFDTLIERDGIVPAPYMAHNKWVNVLHFDALRSHEWEHYLSSSYNLIRSRLPQKIQASLGS